MAADRGPWIDQSQSLNVFMKDPTHAKLTSMHFYGWRRGLKTGMYYLRTQAARDAQTVWNAMLLGESADVQENLGQATARGRAGKPVRERGRRGEAGMAPGSAERGPMANTEHPPET